MPDIRAKSEDALRKELELAGCHDIQFLEPRFQRIAPDPDAELRMQFEPYWAWEIVATGDTP